MTYFPIHARIHAEYRHASGVMRHADYPYPTHTQQKQHEMDRERLDLLLSLNGKPVPNHYFQG